jgi:hypothetical protein
MRRLVGSSARVVEYPAARGFYCFSDTRDWDVGFVSDSGGRRFAALTRWAAFRFLAARSNVCVLFAMSDSIQVESLNGSRVRGGTRELCQPVTGPCPRVSLRSPTRIFKHQPDGNSTKKIAANVTRVRVRHSHGSVPANHELVLPTRIGTIKAELLEAMDEISTAHGTERRHYPTLRTRSCTPPMGGNSRFRDTRNNTHSSSTSSSSSRQTSRVPAFA